MVFDQPNRPSQSRSNPATQRGGSGQPKKVFTTGGGGTKFESGLMLQHHQPKKVFTTGGGGPSGNNPPRGGGGGGGSRPDPSPWLEHPSDPTPNPDSTASFVEYLRWMRSPDSPYKDPTKVQILQMAEEQGNYRERLTQLTERTKLIAGEGNYFQVKSIWRIRVGGHRGPESILLPAFDALGMPYIPSSTLRGVARTQAIRYWMAKEGIEWPEAEQKIAPYFGSLEASQKEDRAGKVIFLDAYPLPVPSGKGGGLSVDIANNIWSWDTNDQDLTYSPNPNPFFSLKEATFLVGIRPCQGCDPNTFRQVREWLEEGLQAGIGSQVNTGYGGLIKAGQRETAGFFRVDFNLEGQLIHGRQRFTEWKWNDCRSEWQMRGQADAEVRSIAFKSMLRYWFRAFSRGVLPSDEVKELEAQLFGSITPRKRGQVVVRVTNGRLAKKEPRPDKQGKHDPCGEQAGTLVFHYSSEAPVTQNQREAVGTLFKTLTWLMFHLGGIGRGARRPCYSRSTRNYAPWWRGSTLTPDSDDSFWALPETVQEFQWLFRQRLQSFYKALGLLVVGQTINPNSPISPTEPVRNNRWREVVDTNCRIVVCTGESRNSKPYALAVLHSGELKQKGNYDPNLCGTVLDARVKPSPIWIADLGDYQVVTVFGATCNPRQQYLRKLEAETSQQNYAQIWSLT